MTHDVPVDWPVDTSLPIAGVDGTGPAQPGAADLSAALAEAQRGNPEAFRVLYRDTQPRLLRYLRALVAEDAEDVASEAWLQAARDLHTFHGDYDRFRGWVATIARHRAIDHLRRRSRRPPTSAVPVEELTELRAGDDTAASALDAVSTDAAIQLIASLPRDQAEAVLLRVVVGLDAESAAKVLGKRSGAVRTAAYRGLRTPARRLGQAGDEQPSGAGGRAPGRAPGRPPDRSHEMRRGSDSDGDAGAGGSEMSTSHQRITRDAAEQLLTGSAGLGAGMDQLSRVLAALATGGAALAASTGVLSGSSGHPPASTGSSQPTGLLPGSALASTGASAADGGQAASTMAGLCRSLVTHVQSAGQNGAAGTGQTALQQALGSPAVTRWSAAPGSPR
jgi:RNA polymerase sigma-70 factor, ECF subfamily